MFLGGRRDEAAFVREKAPSRLDLGGLGRGFGRVEGGYDFFAPVLRMITHCCAIDRRLFQLQ